MIFERKFCIQFFAEIIHFIARSLEHAKPRCTKGLSAIAGFGAEFGERHWHDLKPPVTLGSAGHLHLFSILNVRHRGYPMNRKFFNVYGCGQIHRAGTFTWQPQSAIRGFSELADFGGFWWIIFGFYLKMDDFFGNRLRSLYHTTDFADWVVIPASSPRMTKWSTKMAPYETPPKPQYTYTTPHEMTIFGFRSRKTENSSKAGAE